MIKSSPKLSNDHDLESKNNAVNSYCKFMDYPDTAKVYDFLSSNNRIRFYITGELFLHKIK